MVSYSQLRDLDTTRLTDAAETAGTLAGELSGNAEELTCAAEMPPQMWEGADAESAQLRLGRMPGALEDGSDAFRRGRSGLEDLTEGLQEAREHLEGAHEIAARSPAIVISSSGTVGYYPQQPVSLEEHQHGMELAGQARVIIEEALHMAASADEAAVGQFQSITGDAHGSYFAAFPQAQEDLERVKTLLNYEDIAYDPELLAELNGLLAQYSDDAIFAAEFIDRTNPEALLHRLGEISEFGANLEGDSAEYEDLYLDFQQHFGETLATATREGQVSEEWVQEMMDAGASTMPYKDDNHIGYQVLAPFLEAGGEFGEDFLTPITEHMMRLDKETGGLLGGSDGTAQIEDSDNPYVLGEPTREQANPLNAAMTALGASPDAATAFFNGSRDYADMSYVGLDGDILGAVNDNVAYMMERVVDGSTFAGGHINPDGLGDALEAGATGLSADAPATAERPEHTEEMTRVAGSVVDWVGANPSEVESNSEVLDGMGENLAGITHNYIEDFHHAFTNDETNADAWQMHSHGEPLDLGDYHPERQQNLRQFLQVIGHDQEAAELVWESSMGTMYSEMYGAAVMDGSETIDLVEAGQPHARIMAEMENGQFEAIRDEAFAEAERHNSGLGVLDEVISRGGSEALSEVPVLGRGLSEGWSWGTSQVLDGFRADGVEAAMEGQTEYRREMGEQFDTQTEDVITDALNDSGWVDDMRDSGMSDQEIESEIGRVMEHTRSEHRNLLQVLLDADGRLPD